jgi:hypothetical protein
MATAALRGGDSLKEVQRWKNQIQGQEASQDSQPEMSINRFHYFSTSASQVEKNIFG